MPEPEVWRVWYAYQGEDYVDVLARDYDNAIAAAHHLSAEPIVDILTVEPRP